uniref:Polyprotein n=1 Tax=Cannabis sativa TaxID=3483 RepID=A0A803PZH9_CANSA
MVGCNTSSHIWLTLEKYFMLQVSTKILQFCIKPQNLKKGSLSLIEYLLKVKQIVNLIASVGVVLNTRDHMTSIFKGLLRRYDTFVISTNTQIKSYTIVEIKALLLAFESRIEKLDQDVDMTARVAMANEEYPEANFGTTSQNFKQNMPPRTNNGGG